MHNKKFLLPLIVLLFTLLPLPSLGQPAIDLAGLDHVMLRAPAEFRQAGDELTLEDVRGQPFVPLTASAVNRGISTEAYWIRVRLDNRRSDRPSEWVLHHETSYLDNFIVHYADGGDVFRVQVLSDRLPFDHRPVDYRMLAFSHTTPAGQYTDLYLKLRNQKADGISLNVHLWDADAFQSAAQRENLIHGAYFGILLTLLTVALLCAYLLRQRVYVHYAAFLLFTILMWALINGYAYQYLWPASVFWHNEGFHIVYLLFSITALQFSRGFLRTAQRTPVVDRILLGAQWVMVGGILLRFIGFHESVLYLSYGALAVLTLLPLLGLQAYREGLRYARWYVVAWLGYGIGLLAGVLSASTALLPWGMQALVYTQLGSLFEAFLLMVALGERLANWDKDRVSALRLASQDPLTGLGNRRVLPEAFNALADKHTRSGLPAFILMIDLDRFKEINDNFGHEAGDAVLLHIADMLVRHCRSNDTCIRYGGEEFAMLFQAPSTAEAFEVAERIRQEFSRVSTVHDGRRIRHTLSAGLVQALPERPDVSMKSLLALADQALYMAKRAGRDQIVVIREQRAA